MLVGGIEERKTRRSGRDEIKVGVGGGVSVAILDLKGCTLPGQSFKSSKTWHQRGNETTKRFGLAETRVASLPLPRRDATDEEHDER